MQHRAGVLAVLVTAPLLALLPGCALLRPAPSQTSKHLIIGPKGYTVDWGLPLTGYYWVPPETQDDIKAATDDCHAPPSVFVYHHIPRPPWFSPFGLRFEPDTGEREKSCVVARLKAVPALTIYPKRDDRRRRRALRRAPPPHALPRATLPLTHPA